MAKKKKAQSPVEKAYNRERNRIKRFIREAEKRGYRFSDFSIPDKPKKITEASVRRLQKYNPKYLYEKATFLEPDTGEIVSGQRGRQIERKRAALKAQMTVGHKRAVRQEQEMEQLLRSLHDEDTAEYREAKLKEQEEKLKEMERLQEQIDELQERLRKLAGEEPDEDISEEPDEWIPEEPELDIPHEEFGTYDEDYYTNIPEFSDIVLANIKAELERWTPAPNWTPSLAEAKTHDKNVLESALNGAIEQYGEQAVAQRLQENAEEINTLVQEILYGSGSKEGNFKNGRTQVNFDLARFSAIIMGRPLTVDESIDLTELAETMELEN